MTAGMRLTVHPDDGEPFEVTAGQRDMALWEAQPFGCNAFDALGTRGVTFLRFLAWAAIRRGGQKTPTFDAWSATIDRVDFADDDDDQGKALGPTRRGRRAGGSSTSP
jgi:hypothetical protein